MGSKLEISPYLFNHQYDYDNPPYSQSVKPMQSRSVMEVGTHKLTKVHSCTLFYDYGWLATLSNSVEWRSMSDYFDVITNSHVQAHT